MYYESVGGLDYNQRLLVIAAKAAEYLKTSSLTSQNHETVLPLSPRIEYEAGKKFIREIAETRI